MFTLLNERSEVIVNIQEDQQHLLREDSRTHVQLVNPATLHHLVKVTADTFTVIVAPWNIYYSVNAWCLICELPSPC